jgi:hypothetical protein
LNPNEGGGEKLASDEEIKRMIDEIEKLKRQITNLKLKIRRRVKKLEGAFNPLERQRIEFEVELLKGEIRRFEIVEMQLSIPIIKATVNLSKKKLEDKIDWSKAGKA